GSWEPFEHYLQTELRAVARLAHAWVGDMQARGRGGMLWMGGAEGSWPLFGGPLHVGGRRFLSGLADGLRSMLLESGIQVTEVCHGPTTRETMAEATLAEVNRARLRWAL